MSAIVAPLLNENSPQLDPKVYARRNWTLGAMCLSLVLIVATVSSINVAIPSLAQSALAPSDTQILWIVDAYALVFAALLLPAGAIGDKYGRKGALLIGLVIFASGAALCSVMTSANTLIACRGLMGIGAALIMPSTLSLLQAAFPPAERAKAIAIWSGFAGAGGAIGPVLGGSLVQRFWYGSVFLVAVPIAIVAFVATALFAPRSKELHATPLDLVGAALSISGFAALLAAIIEGPELGWTNPFVLSALAISIAGLAGFVAYEKRATHPMLDMSYFKIPRFAAGSIGITFTFLAMFSTFFVVSQYFQYVRGFSPLSSGLRTLPFAATMVAISPRSPMIVTRFGVRRTVVAGLTVLVGGLLLLSTAGMTTPYPLIALYLVVMACGVAVAMPPLSMGIVQSVPFDKAGVGSAVNDTTREVGGAVGIALIGSIVTSVFRHRLQSSLAVLPPELSAAVGNSVGKAIAVGQQANIPELTAAARQAFVDGAHVGLRVAAAVVIAAIVAVNWRLSDNG